ncbi:cyclic pyranopterin monophosphate synthase MoaC [Methylacidimicrobium tartarophylax]|uniref:Cyclic pyranopterin monophosphate synthase n=1 Tax=Methylacidimicrobium tartarophylax TaxID=1041768 RepID=A0A5E6M517_9BACT|nr:cyclic pyranopterin monophosphate synthase MoaC [Methylacidimicrobium tartarophylax]VVM04425.1 cyclic pyranopterin monophosphate synthase [Methylacidimicrobium tartarophylax]
MKADSLSPSDSFSHLDDAGRARMVRVTGKADQNRRAVAEGFLQLAPETVEKLRRQALPKGDVLTVAQVAGILGAKKTAELIPLCHLLPLHHVEVGLTPERDRIRIVAAAETVGKTGVEMEALTAVVVAALTLYDMCKAVDKGMSIEGVRLLKKEKESVGERTAS